MKTTSINYAPSTKSSIESARSTGQLLIGKLVGFEQNGNPKIDIEGANDGQVLEALSTGAVVLTTNAAPMNEHVDGDYGVLVDYDRQSSRHLGTNFYVDLKKLETAITQLIEMRDEEFTQKSDKARGAFNATKQSHTARFSQFITTIG